METARQVSALSVLVLLAVCATISLTTGNPKPMAAAILAVVIVAFVLVFTEGCEEKDGQR